MAKETEARSDRDLVAALLRAARSIASYSGGRGALAALYVALGAILEGAGLILLVPLLGLVIGSGGYGKLHILADWLFSSLGAFSTLARLSLLVAVFAALVVLRGIVLWLRDTTVYRLQTGYIEHLRGEVAERIASAGWDKVQRVDHARVVNTMGSDMQRIAAMSNYLLQTGIALAILLAQGVLAFLLSPGLALVALLLVLAGGAATVPLLAKARALGGFTTASFLALSQSSLQFLGGLKLALSQNLQRSYVEELRATARTLTARQYGFFRQQTVGRIAVTTLAALAGAGLVLVGYGVLHLSAAVLITFLAVVARMIAPALQVQQGLQQLAFGLASFEAVNALAEELRSDAPATAGSKDVPRGPIVLEGVCYRYRTGQGVAGIDLAIARGSFLGITGPSGAGKTTLADLLVGLLEPQSGAVIVGGTRLDRTNLDAWRAGLSYVAQDPYLFHDSIRRNLLWMKPDASEQDLWTALVLAGADGLVRRLAGGLDGIAGERGTLVSGGERQRIAIARALLRKPALLVMDEATSAIDVDGERVLIEALRAAFPWMTIVMIAHRSESLASCDSVLVMEHGALRERDKALREPVPAS